ncbi:Arabinose 5-phosphate isomerase [Halanaerobium saccharolyticum subsp. saccharolyticum DSM 6643]|uniref:Arabinose 5-phosphate isomerase n=1 Tax=Halanaerobium saccharolyticum subsp. saccharolyticum DSM 6643 TaxID=1293054 RepID=M5EHS1_9FIRM|nr:KpsF/GutQ family sugar-phosphate isomerase [Halanaerobium saccharolyticum]CCU81059.1 Arabinose 5-phosphate isomerase [Halanaerobium saccharolyticum subsp. saccharolyticum DSM 6643]
MTKKSREDKLKAGLEGAKNVLQIEADAVLKLKEDLDGSFKKAMELIIDSEGRVVFTGVGKTGLVAKKLAATFSSTGTSAFFVHAGEALHGDLGMIRAGDVVIAVSNSGETDEVISLLPSLRRIGVTLIALTGNSESTLAEHADLILEADVITEACPHNLAPTASTTAALALGDALAIALSSYYGFSPEDFALYHPGGSLGRKLLTKVKDVIKIREQNPVVKIETTVREALFKMTKSRMGSTSIVDQDGKLRGIITDGDIRRLLEKSADFIDRPVKDYMTVDPISIAPDRLAAEALQIMEAKEINDLPVVEAGKPVAMLNFQDLLRAKVF